MEKLKFKFKKKVLIITSVLSLLLFSYLPANQPKSKKLLSKNSVKSMKKAEISISKEELNTVAEKVFKNEASGIKSNLVYWNTGENFPSLGIGHFIWYKKDERGIFEESFPPLIEYFKSKNVKLPEIIEKNKYAPWTNREELMKLKDEKNPAIEKLTEFLYNTKDIQIEFIFKRLEASLGKMLAISKNKENVKKQFYRVANSPNGLYPLIDYVNFKGEGTNPKERYKEEGWGLLQILENMKGTSPGKEALIEFSDSAKYVLQRRVNNSDPSRNEKRWLEGWFKRCDTYKE
ncbi:hypothetical protein EII29_01940 [Leptotrichia sp. OH3620_COT-345]|uniref:hypothetical protein n=1 Tax=Leptotrichia sp. OH3620_COT-345 TaxID=2491048 RepID=UPI000F64C492|nr:hypothetical protein [Leptotrichia sp. OH3620_COT-345]RRD40718.1 hypothetical protein EII29_01940 [Leptotrichia sp. OH3620_COT-345]